MNQILERQIDIVDDSPRAFVVHGTNNLLWCAYLKRPCTPNCAAIRYIKDGDRKPIAKCVRGDNIEFGRVMTDLL